MIYQQEIKEINAFYEKYKDKKIVYTKEVSQQIGLIRKGTIFKIGSVSVKGALISSTMESLVIMGKLSDILKQTIYDLQGSISVQLSFISKETGKSILLTLHAKVLNMNNQGLGQKDLQFITMKMRRKIPNDLIRIFGMYHEDYMEKILLKKKKVECLLLSNEIKKDCVAGNIDKSKLQLFFDNDTPVNNNQKAIVILKIVKTGEVLEIIGSISNKVNDADGTCHLFLNFSIEDQSPRFGYSIHVLKNLINS